MTTPQTHEQHYNVVNPNTGYRLASNVHRTLAVDSLLAHIYPGWSIFFDKNSQDWRMYTTTYDTKVILQEYSSIFQREENAIADIYVQVFNHHNKWFQVISTPNDVFWRSTDELTEKITKQSTETSPLALYTEYYSLLLVYYDSFTRIYKTKIGFNKVCNMTFSQLKAARYFTQNIPLPK